MNLSVTDPAFLFPGISLLFLAYTNRYLALASVIRALNSMEDETDSGNRLEQIRSLHVRITLIKYMQAFGVFGFLLCVTAMLLLITQYQSAGEIVFVGSLICMMISLLLSLIEIMKSGQSLKIELDRTHIRKP
ncbi:MAG: DUF2721 domain-containing protein [Acidiferrobacterales bacterium]|nr:DUF2721 domain-containing protein [Acidiferrobacterales bacterium]